MLDILRLPCDIQQVVRSEYRHGLRERMSTIQYHVRTFCVNDTDRMLDWMAHMLKYPNVKPPQGIVLIGPPGCGKSLFAQLLTLLLGQDKVVYTPTLPRFNGCLEGATLVHLDECLKPQVHRFISDQTLAIRRPYQDPYNVPSYHRVLVTTTFMSPLLTHSEAFQQRFTVIPCGVFFKPQDLRAAMDDPVRLASFRQHLMERQV